jgi:hypothetical protein
LGLLVGTLSATANLSPAQAAAGSGWGVEQLMQQLAQVKSAKHRYTERKQLRVLTAPLDSSGILVYQAPGHLEKHTLTPRAESLSLDGDVLTMEDKGRKQRRTLMLYDYPVIWAFVESIRSTLAGDWKTLSRFYQVEFEGEAQMWRLTLVPRDAKMKAVVSDIRISGSQAAIGMIEINEASGDRSVMRISESAP